MNRPVGLVAALPSEAKALKAGLSESHNWQKKAGRRFYRARLTDGTPVLVAVSGMGMQNAFSTAMWMAQQGISALGSVGVSGGLDERLVPGDCVLADKVLSGTAKGIHVVWKREQGIPPSDVSGRPSQMRGAILTVQEPLLATEDKKDFSGRSHAMAVDMESAAVAQAACQMNLMFFAIRAICDTVTTSIPEEVYSAIDEMGRPRVTYILRQLGRNPALICQFLRTKRDFKAASNCIQSHFPQLICQELRHQKNLKLKT